MSANIELKAARCTSATELEQPRLHVLLVLSLLMGFASISTDLYLPSMPAIGQALHAGAGMVEFTITGYLIGFSLGQLLWGPISDRYGRRWSIVTGLILFIAGSTGCAMANSLPALIGWRLLQALGACASVALSRAMVRDLYTGDKAAQMMSVLITIMAVAPLLGPLLGGQIALLGGWRAVFWTLVGIGIFTLIALFTIPETHPKHRRNTESLGRAMANYGKLLANRHVLGYSLIGGFFYIGIFAYVAGTPFAYITYYHLEPRYYGLLFGVCIVGIMISNLVNSRLVVKIGFNRMLIIGTFISAVFSVISAIMAYTGIGGLAGLFIPLLLFNAMGGFVIANSITGALSVFPERSGAVSALTGAIQYGSGIIGSGLIGYFADGTPWPMGWTIALAGVGSLISALIVQDKKE